MAQVYDDGEGRCCSEEQGLGCHAPQPKRVVNGSGSGGGGKSLRAVWPYNTTPLVLDCCASQPQQQPQQHQEAAPTGGSGVDVVGGGNVFVGSESVGNRGAWRCIVGPLFNMPLVLVCYGLVIACIAVDMGALRLVWCAWASTL